MKIAVGMIIILFVLAVIYFFLPPGIKTTINAVFFGTNTQQTRNQPSPTSQQANATISPINLFPNVSPSPTGAPPTPSPIPATTQQAKTTTKTSTMTTSTSSATNSALPGTGFEVHHAYMKVMATALSILLLLVGVKLSKYKT